MKNEFIELQKKYNLLKTLYEELCCENEKLKADNFLFYQDLKKDEEIINTLKKRLNAIYGLGFREACYQVVKLETANGFSIRLKGVLSFVTALQEIQ